MRARTSHVQLGCRTQAAWSASCCSLQLMQRLISGCLGLVREVAQAPALLRVPASCLCTSSVWAGGEELLHRHSVNPGSLQDCYCWPVSALKMSRHAQPDTLQHQEPDPTHLLPRLQPLACGQLLSQECLQAAAAQLPPLPQSQAGRKAAPSPWQPLPALAKPIQTLLICPVLSCAIPWHSNGARTPSIERIYCSSALPAMICQSVSSCFAQSGLVAPFLRCAGRLQHCPQHSPTGLIQCAEGRPPATLTSLKA